MSPQLEGRRPVLEALRSGRVVRKLLVAAEMRRAPVIEEIRELARERGVPVEEVPRHEIDRRASSHAPQGIIALVPEFAYATMDDALRRATERGEQPLLVALDGVTDPGNAGAVARTAEAAGAHGLVLPERRAAPVTPAVEKAAAGALAHLPVVRVGNLPTALARLKEAGIWIVALDTGGPSTVWDLPVASEPLCLVVGAEGRGVARLVRERADLVASIPMAGNVESLNVSVASGVALFAIVRARQTGQIGRTPPKQPRGVAGVRFGRDM